jgi:hypothetical protein
MQNISGFNTRINLIASKTFPVGFTITEFADDGDPIDSQTLQIGDSAMGLNGDLIVWSKANPIKIALNVIPNGADDTNLSILFEANRVGKGKIGAQDILTMNIIYPDGRFTQLINGTLIEGLPFNGVQSAGRLKTKSYSMVFENKIGS